MEFMHLPVCPLFFKVVCSGRMWKPSITNGGNFFLLTVSEFILIGLWCLPKHVLYCSPQCAGPRNCFQWKWRENV